MDGSELEIIESSRGGVANGVQNAYADALKTAGSRNTRPPPSIGYQCPVYAPGMEPLPVKIEPFSEDTKRSNSPAP